MKIIIVALAVLGLIALITKGFQSLLKPVLLPHRFNRKHHYFLRFIAKVPFC